MYWNMRNLWKDHQNRLRSACVGALALAALGFFGTDAKASRYATSASPLWRVGRPDAALTQACRRWQFNQLKEQRLFIGFVGDNGRGITGIAKLGWNLRDPLRLARPGLTYHFVHDGQSTCTVFVAGKATIPTSVSPLKLTGFPAPVPEDGRAEPDRR